MKKLKQSTRSNIKDYAAITIGMIFAALGIYFFMMPDNIILGSITGLAIILSEMVGKAIPVSIMTFILNVICLVIGFVFIGKEFGAKTVYSSMLLPLFLNILEHLFPNQPPLTDEILLNVICCIVILSVGQALMFNANASSGGLDILAKVLNKYLHVELGKGVAAIGVLTVAMSIMVYDIPTLVLGFMGTYFNGLVVDFYVGGFARRKRVCILSDDVQPITDYILHTLKRGVTLYNAHGAHSGTAKEEIVTILANSEYGQLMEHLRKNHPSAFVTVSTVNEVAGRWNTRSGEKQL